MIVLDASALVELVLDTEAGRRVAARIDRIDESLHAPHLLTVEVAQVLRRLAATGELTETRSAEALQDATDLDVEHYEHELLIARAWDLRDNLTMYDAVYVALAELLDAPLVTFDERLASAPGHRARIDIPR